MKAINLIHSIKPYKSGWVAIDGNNNKVVAHAESFGKISDKIKENKSKNVYLMPASDNYFGFITHAQMSIFPYTELPAKKKTIFIPFIKVILNYKKTHKITPPTVALVDSGADVCMCTKDIGRWLDSLIILIFLLIIETKNLKLFNKQPSHFQRNDLAPRTCNDLNTWEFLGISWYF